MIKHQLFRAEILSKGATKDVSMHRNETGRSGARTEGGGGPQKETKRTKSRIRVRSIDLRAWLHPNADGARLVKIRNRPLKDKKGHNSRPDP